MGKLIEQFWGWYEKNYTFNIGFTAVLLVLQFVHLYWLTTDVVFFRLFGESFFSPTGLLLLVLIIVDYLEIPAIVSASILYLHKLKHKFAIKEAAFLAFINIQWLHLFWITDEFVVELVRGSSIIPLPPVVLWLAISIDYLELPVIFDALKKFFRRAQLN